MMYYEQYSVLTRLQSKFVLRRRRAAGAGGGRPGLLVSLLSLALLGGCVEEANQYAPPPPPEVTVANPKVQDVVEYRYFTGQTAAKASVEIRARVKGFLQEIHFEDGLEIEQGDLLFTIDPREYEADVAHAEAELLNARTALDFAENSFQRIAKAGKAKAIAELEVIKSQSERDKAKADVAAAEAALQQAQLNLSYTQIKAPISGKVSRRQVDIGNLVGVDGGTVLTNIVNVDPVYVYVSVSERDVVRLLRSASQNPGKTSEQGTEVKQPFELALATEEGFPHPGVLTYLDNQVDPETGTIQVRGELPNSEYLIIPGLFARIRVPFETRKDALLIPEHALGIDQAGRYALVVDEKNIVDRRPVVTGAQLGTLRVIESGLEAGDRVVVKGILRARPGSEVRPEMATLDELQPMAVETSAEELSGPEPPAAPRLTDQVAATGEPIAEQPTAAASVQKEPEPAGSQPAADPAAD